MAKRSPIEQADIKVAQAVAPVRHSPAIRLLGALSELADQPPLNAICATTFAIGLLTGNRRLASAGGRMLAAQLLSTLAKSAIKRQVDRTRPRVADDGGVYAMKRGHSRQSEDNSFPSGHTAGAVAVARAFVRDYPEHSLAAFGAAAAVAAIQLPRCQHYPSDLAAGAAVGLASEALVRAAETRMPGA